MRLRRLRENVSDITSLSESTKPKTLYSEISSFNNSVEGYVECNVENNVTTENIDNSSVNICSEATVLEGNSAQLDKNVGVAVATSFSSLSGPAGLSSSRVPAEVAVSPEPSGPRKISTRKSSAARFSPMEGLGAIQQHSRMPPFSGRPKKQYFGGSGGLFFLPLVMALKIATLNINGLRDANKRMSFTQWLHFVDWDVLCLQESHVTSKDECGAWFSSAGYDSVVSPSSNRSHGSVILFKNSISLKNHWMDSEGRLVLGEFAIRELSYRVCCVYAPNQERIF